MNTFARIVDGFAVDCRVAPNQAALAKFFHPAWLAAQVFIVVPDGTVDGARDNGNGTFTNPPEIVPPAPQPNNPNNPYFGKTPIYVKDFFTIVGQALTSGRYKRLRNDAAFLWIYDMLNALGHDGLKGLVDPDDRRGAFLQIVSYMLDTDAEDGQKLMTPSELGVIMAEWPEIEQ